MSIVNSLLLGSGGSGSTPQPPPANGSALFWQKFIDTDMNGERLLNPYKPVEVTTGEAKIGIEWVLPFPLTGASLTSLCRVAGGTAAVAAGSGLTLTINPLDPQAARLVIPGTLTAAPGKYYLRARIERDGAVDYSSVVWLVVSAR